MVPLALQDDFQRVMVQHHPRIKRAWDAIVQTIITRNVRIRTEIGTRCDIYYENLRKLLLNKGAHEFVLV